MKKFSAFTLIFVISFIFVSASNADWSPGSQDTGFANANANGVINEVVRQHDGKYIAVGNFTEVQGVTRNRIARYNADGTLDETFNSLGGPSAEVFVVAVQADGMILIGGKFDSVAGEEQKYLARLHPTGMPDYTFKPIITSAFPSLYPPITDILVEPNGNILITGNFHDVNGTLNTWKITRLNSDGTIADTHLGFLDEYLSRAVRQPDGRLLIVENPTSPVSQLTRLNSDLTVDTSFTTGTGANGLINDLAITPDDKIIAVGDFTEYNGTPQNGVVKLDANGLLDLLWNPGTGANGSIKTVSVNEKGEIFIGGDFTAYNGETATRIAKLDANGVMDEIFGAFGGANGTVNDVLVQGNGQIAVAGEFTQLGGWTTDHFGRLNRDGSPDNGFDVSTGANNDAIYAVANAPDGKLYVGGGFTSVQGVFCPKIARLNADGTVDTTFNPGLGPDDDVKALAVQPNGQVIAVGMFDNVGTEAYHGYARYNTDGHLDTNWGFGSAGANFAVYDVLLQPDGKTLLAGWFTSLDGHSANFIGLLGASGYYDPSFNSGTGFNDAVYTLEQAPNGNVFVGGRFTSYNDLSAGRIVSITPNGTRDASFNTGTGFNSNVFAFANASGGKLYVGGDYSSFDGTPANRITRLNSDGSRDTTFDVGTGPNGRVNYIDTQGDKVLVGGNFSAFDGQPAACLVRLNQDGSRDPSFIAKTGCINRIYDGFVQPDDNRVVVGGIFTTSSAQQVNPLVRLNGATPPSFTGSPPDLTIDVGQLLETHLGATGIPTPTFSLAVSGTVGTESFPTQILTTTNGPPPGLTLSESGVISGTATTAGIYTFTVRVSNYVAPSVYQTMTITVVEAGETKIYLPLITR